MPTLRPFSVVVEIPGLEEQMTGGAFASGALPDCDESCTHCEDGEFSPAEEEEMERLFSRPVERRIAYDSPVTVEMLQDPYRDLAGIVATLSDDALVLLCESPDICGTNAERVLMLASEELVKRLVLAGRMPAA